MGPKKGKEVHHDQFWRTQIEDARLDEENWTVRVVVIEGAGSEQDRIYLNKFEIFAAEERRFVIKNICKTETIFMINQLGGEKKVKDDNLRVFEEGQAYLKDKKDIPPEILALIIKHLILKMKEEYLFIKRQKLEVKEGIRRESTTMIEKTEVRGAINQKAPEPPEVHSSAKGKTKKGDLLPELPEPEEGKKYKTALRVRGEEWRDKVYVDDFPIDGPNLYVAVTGFVEPLLPGCLVKIGIPLTAIVTIRIDPRTSKVPSTLFRATKRGQSQTEMLAEQSLHFWEHLQQLRINKDTANYFKKTAFIIFSPPYWDSEKLSGNPEKIYDELCFLMYDIQDLSRQHIHYLDNMNIVHIPEETTNEVFKKFYHQLIDDIPLECVTIYSVLDSILQTVCKIEELRENISKSSLSTALTLNQSPVLPKFDDKIATAEKFVTEVFNTLCKIETYKKTYRITYGEEYENHKDPIVINYGDFAKYTTFHLGNTNLDNIVWSTLFGMPINRLWLNQDQPKGELEAKINFHVNVLLSCFNREDVETAELNRLIHILACRKLFNNRSSLKKHHPSPSTITEFKKVYLKRSVLAEPLSQCPALFKSCSTASPSFPSMTKSENVSDIFADADLEYRRIKLLFDCPDISELVSAAEIENDQPINHMIDDYEYFEDFKGINAFQILLDAFNKFNCLDYKFCEVTDCLILMFFNSHDKDGIAREEWRCHLPTPLCLQDYFDFVLDEHYGWIQNEERIYDERMAIRSQSECKVFTDVFAGTSCIENTEVEMELLMEGSLKYHEIAQIDESTSDTTDKATSAKKTVTSVSSTDVDTKSSRKTKSPAVSTPKNVKHPQNYMAFGNKSDSSIETPKKPFSGYDLGDRRVEVFGKDSAFFSKDGTRVSSVYTLVIPMNLEYIILKVVPGNGSNEFWIHKAIGDNITTEVIDMCQSFRITSKNQVSFYIKKQSYQENKLMLPPSVETAKLKEAKIKSPSIKSPQLSQIIPKVMESKSFYSLYITWPNGLVTESVHEPNSPKISYIKQSYVLPKDTLEEKMRCISLNGEVIIFKNSGDIEVLCPDGSYIKIIKCERRAIISEVVEHHSEVSSDKSKKGKDKGKHSKTSSKSSKNVINEDAKEHIIEEFRLFIEDFELIDANGLRQRWVNDIPHDIERLLIRTATDYCLGEVFSRRMDGTYTLINKDGAQIVTFPNNTRIVTKYIIEDFEIYPEWTKEEKEYFEIIGSDISETETTKSKDSLSQKSYLTNESVASSVSKKPEGEEIKERKKNDGYVSIQVIYTIEHANFTTITINKANGNISIDSPNHTSVVMATNNHYEITLDDSTSAKFNGENLYINYEACPKCRSYTNCDIIIRQGDVSSATKVSQNWLRMNDSFCKKIIVNEEGSISLMEDELSYETFPTEETHLEDKENSQDKTDVKYDGKSESSVISHSKCREIYQTKNIRFFILQRDLTCSEIIHRALVEQYKQSCRWQPWCTINQYDTFGDYRSLLSILTPVNLTETEKWLMDSKLSDKPTYLTYKDLKKDCGKGFYHWMRPYERFEPKHMKPENVLPPRLPRAYILRTLEKQWGESEREELKGAKELLVAILRYRQIMAEDSATILQVPIIDVRPEVERRTDDIIQALSHRIYEDLKMRLNNDIQSRAKPTITTKPQLSLEEISIEGETNEETDEFIKVLEEERDSLVKEVEEAEEMSPNLKRYWRRRLEERKEEEFYRYLLREGSVPPYFRNVLGGAIWWEMNSATDAAVTKAEGRKMKCVCAIEEATSHTTDTLPPLI